MTLAEGRRNIHHVIGAPVGLSKILVFRVPCQIAALAIAAGWSPELVQSGNTSPVWAFVGDRDKNNVKSVSVLMKAMRECGAQPKVTVYKEKGHAVWNDACAEKGLYTWLFSQSLSKQRRSASLPGVPARPRPCWRAPPSSPSSRGS